MIQPIKLHVEGMTCGHCVKAVHDRVKAFDAVDEVDVHLETGEVDIEFDPEAVEIREIIAAIEDEGCNVKTC